MKLDILFENEHFVILDKPALVLSVPSREGKNDERPCLGIELQTHLKQQIFPVHRLDYEVSGLVLFAKNEKAHARANTWFEHKQVFKTYQALSEGPSFEHIPPQIKNPRVFLKPTPGQEFLWKSKLLRGKKRAYEHGTGKPCETLAIYRGPDAQAQGHRWELHPLTGRPHQLRFELSTHGFPIQGDELYGSKHPYQNPGIALRALEIDFSKAPEAKDFLLPSKVQASRGLF